MVSLLLWAILLVLIGIAFPFLWPLIGLILVLMLIGGFIGAVIRDLTNDEKKEQFRLFKQQTTEDFRGLSERWRRFRESDPARWKYQSDEDED